MKNLLLFCILITLFMCNCSNNIIYGQPVVKPNEILKNFTTYWEYHNKYVKLNRDFIALDNSKNVITKMEFFKKILDSSYLPLRLNSKDGDKYELYKIPNGTNADIYKTILQEANQDYLNFNQENRQIGNFDFLDIGGITFNNVNTKGKIIVLKCWFIGCTKCIEEFPQINTLVKTYKDNKNLLFLSLAIDKKEDLEKFLYKMPLNFKVIPNQKKYLVNILKVYLFPTHFIVKDGIILKRVNTYEDLEISLHKILSN